MRAFEILATMPSVVAVQLARAAVEVSPCCEECTYYPGARGICVRCHTCPCHDVEVDL